MRDDLCRSTHGRAGAHGLCRLIRRRAALCVRAASRRPLATRPRSMNRLERLSRDARLLREVAASDLGTRKSGQFLAIPPDAVFLLPADKIGLYSRPLPQQVAFSRGLVDQ